MPLCALKIGDHVWKVTGRDQHKQLIVETVQRLLPNEDGTFQPDLGYEDKMIFVYIRTNQNGIEEYGYVFTAKARKEGSEGQSQANQDQDSQGHPPIHLYRVP